MGTWGQGAFENDAAADFLDTLQSGPARVVTKALRKIANLNVGTYIEVDDGSAGWAACELVALAFGRGDVAALGDHILDIVTRLRPKEDDRLLALEVLPRLVDPERSELAGLWSEGGGGREFGSRVDDLRSRLNDAATGPRELRKAKIGDVIAISAAPGSTEFVVVQVVGPGEVAVFEGACPHDVNALQWSDHRPARRVPAPTNKLMRRGRLLANAPVRKDLKGKKLYASETADLGDYFLSTALGGGMKSASFEEARHHDAYRNHDEEDIRGVALRAAPTRRLPSPDELEAELCVRNRSEWDERRRESRPGPFGDLAELQRLLRWFGEFGTANAIRRFSAEADGTQWSGPSEHNQRDNYAFAGIVALWRGTWGPEVWPPELAGCLPPVPGEPLFAEAISTARVLASRIITRNSELRMIWDSGPDKGAELRRIIASLQFALAQE